MKKTAKGFTGGKLLHVKKGVEGMWEVFVILIKNEFLRELI